MSIFIEKAGVRFEDVEGTRGIGKEDVADPGGISQSSQSASIIKFVVDTPGISKELPGGRLLFRVPRLLSASQLHNCQRNVVSFDGKFQIKKWLCIFGSSHVWLSLALIYTESLHSKFETVLQNLKQRTRK
jgi:hypothetical protein